MKTSCDERLKRVLRLHLDPVEGSRYWLEKERELGFPLLREIRSVGDLWRLGAMRTEDLAARPLADFIPRRFLTSKRPLITAETGGATGFPKTTAYFEDEFTSVFVDSFFDTADAAGFPSEGPWLWVGPSGPHIIGKAAMAIARGRGGSDAFAVDFDPRWYRTLAPESIARRRYLSHLIDQASRVVRQQAVRCIFSTPVVLAALAEGLEEKFRAGVRGIYLGGMTVEAAVLAKLETAFPRACFVSGYGNTLFGVCHAAGDLRGSGADIRYFPPDGRLFMKLVPVDDAVPADERLRATVAYGEEGQVLFHRFDESFFLANVLERDAGVRVAAGEAETRMGWTGDGVLRPGPLKSRLFTVDAGIY